MVVDSILNVRSQQGAAACRLQDEVIKFSSTGDVLNLHTKESDYEMTRKLRWHLPLLSYFVPRQTHSVSVISHKWGALGEFSRSATYPRTRHWRSKRQTYMRSAKRLKYWSTGEFPYHILVFIIQFTLLDQA